MTSLMNNDFELDRKSDVVEGQLRTTGVSGDHVVSSDKLINNGGVNGACASLIKVSFMDCKRVDGEMESRVRESKNQGVTSRVSDNEFSEQSDGADQLKSKAGDGVNSSEGGGHAESTPREIDVKVNVWNGKIQHMGSKAGKGNVEVGESNVSQYYSMLSMFDEFAANGGCGAVVVGPLKPLGYGYEVGDMVWGKVKSHPWWPGQIYSEAFATPLVRRSRREGHVLVAFFGDSSYGWFDPAELIPFDSNFNEKSRQTNSRTFTKAVEEAVNEASRRHALGLACRCRNPYNFRPTEVQGYFAIDVGDYEPGSLYSANQIRKARDGFQTRETLAFIKRLALAPTSDEHGGIYFIKNKATVLSYRKAAFEEFDETYAQAFGYQPVRPSRGPTQDVAQQPSRAPLSGPLVIAEALGKGKNAKTNKTKDQGKKERYIFKRRDEPNELKTHQINQATSSAQPVYEEDSLAIAAGESVLQKSAPAVSVKPQIPAKHEQTGTIDMDGSSRLSRDVTGKESVTTEEKPSVSKFSMAGSHMNAGKVEFPANSPAGLAPGYSSHLLEARSSLHKGKGAIVEVKESLGSDLSMGPISRDGSGLVDDIHCTFEPGVAVIPFKDDHVSSTAFKVVDDFEQPPSQPATVGLHGREQVRDGCSGPHCLEATNAKLHGGGSSLPTDSGAKKAKVCKRPVGEPSTVKSVPSEKKRKKELTSSSTEKSAPLEKKKKKKTMKELMSSDGTPMHSSAGNGGASVGKLPGKSVQLALVPREDFHVDHKKKDDRASTSLSTDAGGSQLMAGMGHVELELPQLLSDLQALALNPFHGVERSPAVIRQVFFRFRSLVYQKSLASLPRAENESNETHTSKSPAVSAAYDNPPGENVRDPPLLKPPKCPVRTDDPSKVGRKRGPSDRQEEMAAKKKKKINDLKLLSAEKKPAQKTPEVQRGDGKESFAPITKSVKPESFKKMEPLTRSPDPAMLVMKFPPGGTLPSMSELKARFARFGPMDHSSTRVLWKSLTCRIVYWHKLNAQVAYKFAVGSSNLFGNTNVRCYLQELGVAAPESESGKVLREDASNGTPQFRDSAFEQRPATPLPPQPLQQPGAQLKSCLKKWSGDEAGSFSGGNGIGRGSPRVKFILGGEESSRGEQLMVGNKNNFNDIAIFADGGASSSSSLSSSSSSHAMDFISRNFQNIVIPPPLPPLLPLPPTTSTSTQFRRPPNNLHYTTEVAVAAPRNAHYFNSHTATPMPMPMPSPTPSPSNVDIAPQMLSLLTRCNDVVNNVIGLLGYVPYHPL